MNILSNGRFTADIQQYLTGMAWVRNKEYRAEKLLIFLRGAECTLVDEGITFKLEGTYIAGLPVVYHVIVYQYEDPLDCYSAKKKIGVIYADKIDVLVEE